MNSVYIARHHRAEAMADGERKMAAGYKYPKAIFLRGLAITVYKVT